MRAILFISNERAKRLFVLVCFVALVIVFRLLYLQFFLQEEVSQQGKKSYQKIWREQSVRGRILDRNGEDLAISIPVSNLFLNSRLFLKSSENKFVEKLKKCKRKSQEFCELTDLKNFRLQLLNPVSEILGESSENILQDIERINKSNNHGHWLLRKNMRGESANKIVSLKIDGFTKEDLFQRFYPTESVFTRVLGFNAEQKDDIEGSGLGGIEKQFDNLLKGISGKFKVIQDGNGNVIKVLEEIEPTVAGKNLKLSLDKRIQYINYQILQEALEKFKAKAAHSVMVDIKTGEILAMVSLPSTNPNIGSERKPEFLHNPVLQDVYEPGSVIKPFVVAAALDAKVINLGTIFKTKKIYFIAGNKVEDVSNYGNLDTRSALKKSSNVAMAMISEKLPRKYFYEYLKNLGFGSKVLGFNSEVVGNLNEKTKLNDFAYATQTFGYGLSTTLIQLAQAYSVIANDGKKVNLKIELDVPEALPKQVINPRIAKNLQSILYETVESGTAKRAISHKYSLAGKTGTVHKLKFIEKKQADGSMKKVAVGYEKNKYLSSFAGFAPANKPQVVLIVMIDEPDKNIAHFGGEVAAPVFSKIIDKSLPILGIQPDKIILNRHLYLKNTEEGNTNVVE